MGGRRTVVLAGVVAVLAAVGAFRALSPGPASAPGETAPPGCADAVAVAWGEDQERLGCVSGLAELVSAAAVEAGCAVEPPAGVVPGDRVVLGAADAGRCAVRVEPLPGASLRALGLPVDVNRAREADLRVLPGIGPGRARAIVEERTAHGPFRGLRDLVRVRGIGPATVAALEGRAVAGPGSGADAPAEEAP